MNKVQSDISPSLHGYWHQRHAIPGSFEDIDFLLFDRILRWLSGNQGDLLEIGTYLGKSAAVIGQHATAPTKFIALDLFDDQAADSANTRENVDSYMGLSQDAFLANYRKFVSNEPVVVKALSSEVRNHVADVSLKFAHIDGGHLYEVVREDLMNVKALLNADGVVVLDDFRAVHTPGVAASVWAAVVHDGLIPVCVSEAKFYGSWSPDVATALRSTLTSWLQQYPEVPTGIQGIAGHEVLLVNNPPIWTLRRRIKAALPPAITDRLLRRPAPHLGV